MVTVIKFTIGLSLSILLGYFVKKLLIKLVPEPQQPEGLDNAVWSILTERIDSGKWVGFFERILCLVAFWIGQFTIIAAWFAFKLAAKWEVWKNIIRLPDILDNTSQLLWFDARRKIGSNLLARFLLGTLINVLIGVTAAYLGKHPSALAIILMQFFA